jgi:hypothetical protein
VTTDEERWAEARELLTGSPSPEAETRMRRRRRLLWISLGGLVVLAAAAGLVAGLLAPHHRSSSSSGGSTALALVLYGLGLGLEVTGLVVLVRSGGLRTNLTSPTSVLSRHQRRSLLRQVNGRQPADPASLPLARDLARRLSAQFRALPLVFSGLAFTGAGRLAGHPTAVQIGIESVSIVLLTAAAGFGVRQSRQAHRFLAEHPAPPGS